MARQSKNYFRILSFDGGGVRAILPAIFLARLEKAFPKMIENTNLFVGTSAGSFIALALANGIKPEKIVSLFSYENTKLIFHRSRFFYLFRPKYRNANLINLLETVFSPTLRLKDLPHRVVIPAFRIHSDGAPAWEPVFFNNFPSSANADTPVIDVALASSAAPIFFPSHQNYIDGGVIANNPDLVAISYAVGEQAARAKLQNVVHLSFGTGWNPLNIDKNTQKWGLFQWVYSLLPKETTPKLPLFSVLTDGDVAADMFVTKNLLNDRYLRVSPELHERIHLDDYTKIPKLAKIAEQFDLSQAREFVRKYWCDEAIINIRLK